MARIGVCLTVVAVLIAFPCLAAGPGAPEAAPDSGPRGEEVAFADVPIVITAAKKPQRLTEAPATIDVVTAAEIADRGALTLQQVLRLIPGIDLRIYGVRTEINIRGITGLDRVLCLVDGRRINSAFDGSFRGDLPLTNVERIEIVRGPGSALYGPNAFGGVINIITRNGSDLDGVSLSAGAGSDGTLLAEVLAGKEFAPIEALLTYGHFSTDGQELVNENDHFSENDLFAKVSWKGLTLSAGHDEVDRGIEGRIARESLTDHLIDTTDFGDLSFAEQWGVVGVTLRGHVSKRTNDYSLNRVPLTYESVVKGAEAQANWSINGSNFLITGIDYRNDEGGQSGDNRTTDNTGLFLEYESRPMSPLILTLGARYDMHSVYEDVFTPRLSAIYLLGDSTSLRASYGEAFRAPSIQDLYVDFYLAPTVHMIGNPDLKPEKLKTYEIGAIHSFGNRLSGSIAFFSTEAKDLIQIVPQFSRGIVLNTPQNIGEANITGIEVGVKGNPLETLSFFLNYSYLDAVDADGNRLQYIPYGKVNAGVTVEPVSWGKVNLTARYVGERAGNDSDTRSAVTLDDYTVIDLAAQASWGRYSLRVSVQNVFDQKYEETFKYPMPRRSYLAALACRF